MDVQLLCPKVYQKISVQVYLFQKLTTSGGHVVYKNCSESQNKKQKQFMHTTCSPDVMPFAIFMNNLL